MAKYHQQGRFFDNEFPEVEELVMIKIEKVDDKMGAYVSLLEYGNREGMINLSEVSKRRIRSMAKLLRVGSTEVCLVASVDEDKGYINLSKKRVANEDIPPKLEQFAKTKAIHGIMQHVASTAGIDVEDLCHKVSWPLNVKYGTAMDGFKKHTNGEIDVWKDVDWTQPGLDLSERKDELMADIKTHLDRRLIQAQVRLQAKCEVSCSGYEGVDAVKEALMEGFKASKEDTKVDIKLVAHPLFALTCLAKDKEFGVAMLDDALARIEESITKKEGKFELRLKPAVHEDAPKDKEEESDSDSDSNSSEGEQDETMGNLDEKEIERLKKMDLEADKDDDDK